MVRRSLSRFIVVGASATLAYFLLTYLLLHVCGLSPVWSAIGAYLLVFPVAYYGQRQWAFAASVGHGRALSRYATTQVICSLTGALVARLVHDASVPDIVVAASSTLASSGLSYVLSSRWVFAG